MINLYAYTYPSAVAKFIPQGFILVKAGDTHRDTEIRIGEQGGSAEWEGKIIVGAWLNLKNIKRDYQVHNVLKMRGLHHKDGAGTEWFKIPANSLKEANQYLDDIITELEGHKVRKSVKLRKVQQRALDQALEIIEKNSDPSIIANLCPRFGKTIWALMLFNEISKRYGNKVMLLPAYWLSVHNSFENELDGYDDFLDIREIDPDDPTACDQAVEYLKQEYRIVIPISLHGSFDEWKIKHEWISNIPNNEIFMFADEGDFGTHTENQVAKLDYLFNN